LTESVKIIKKNGGVDWLNNLREEKDMDKIKDNLISLKGVGKKVAYCISLFSMDCPGIIPVDTHVFQLAQKFGFIKSSKTKANLND
jgi:N-glycosylase/DNA lyase